MTRNSQPDACIIYVRMSAADIRRARQEAHGDMARLDELIEQKITAHLDECRRYAAGEGWAVLGTYTDNMISGSARYRRISQHLTGREAMLADLRTRAGQPVIVLSTEVERLYRDTDESRELVGIARLTPITVVSTDGETYDLTSSNGEAAFEAAVSKGQREAGKVSERRRRKERTRAEAGDYWGTEPFGYHKVYDIDAGTGARYFTGRLELCDENCPGRNGCVNTGIGAAGPGGRIDAAGYLLDEDGSRAAEDDDAFGDDWGLAPGGRGEAELIRTAARRLVGSPDEPARSLHSIVRDWHDFGATTRKGERWTQVQLRNLLLNKRLNGIRVHRAGDKWGRADRRSRGTETPGNWPKILDDDLFMAVQGVLLAPAGEVLTSNGKLIKVNRTMAPGGNARRHLLAGLAFCGTCGARMKGHPGPAKVDGTPTTRYKCPSPPDGCGGTHRSAEMADRWVVGHVLNWIAPDGPYAAYVARERALYAAGQAATAGELARNEAEQRELAARLTGITQALAAGDITPGTAAYGVNMAAVEQIEARQRELGGRSAALRASVPPAPAGDPRELAAQLGPGQDVQDRHELIRRFVAKVIIRPPGQGTRYVFDPDTIEVVPAPWADGLEPQELAGSIPPGIRHREKARTAVARFLADHPGSTPKDIAVALGHNHNFTCTVLAHMREDGEVIPDRPGRGGPAPLRYTLTGNPAQARQAARIPSAGMGGVTVREAITAHLTGTPGSAAADIADKAGIPRPSVYAVVKEMRDAGQITPDRPGRGNRSQPILYSLAG